MSNSNRKAGLMVVWPANIDSQKTRDEGRKVPKSVAVDSPTADEIFEASKELNFAPILENTKRLPSVYWERTGRVLVLKKDKKLKVLRQISTVLQKKRALKRKQQ